MALWGVSCSDLKNCGWNTVVGLGVAAGCAGVAYAAQRLGKRIIDAKPKCTTEQKAQFAQYNQWASFALGTGIAVAANMYIPGSRFALITDLSTSKMFKLGAVQTVVGLVLDLLARNNIAILATAGLGGAVAGRFSNYALIGFGALGAALGSGTITR